MKLVLLFGLAAMAAGQTAEPVAGASSFDLSPAQQRTLISQANKDHGKDKGKPAFQLYQYFEMVKLDRRVAIGWLKKAAAAGNTIAQYNLGKLYLDDPAMKDPAQARHWLQKAAATGDPDAKAALSTMAPPQ